MIQLARTGISEEKLLWSEVLVADVVFWRQRAEVDIFQFFIQLLDGESIILPKKKKNNVKYDSVYKFT